MNRENRFLKSDKGSDLAATGPWKTEFLKFMSMRDLGRLLHPSSKIVC